MNGSSFRGGAFGFKIGGLLNLSDVKPGAGAKFASLLHYVESLIYLQDPSLLNFMDEMLNVPDAQRVSVSTISAGIKDLQNGMSEIQRLIQALEVLPLDPSDRFVSVMSAFVEEKLPKVQELQAQAETMEKLLKDLLSFFGEDASSSSEELFSIINRFSLNLKKAHVENEQTKEQQSKPKVAPPVKPKIPGMGMGMGMGVGAGDLDNAINALKRGKSFKGKREERRNNLLSGGETVAPEAMLRLQNLRKTGS